MNNDGYRLLSVLCIVLMELHKVIKALNQYCFFLFSVSSSRGDIKKRPSFKKICQTWPWLDLSGPNSLQASMFKICHLCFFFFKWLCGYFKSCNPHNRLTCYHFSPHSTTHSFKKKKSFLKQDLFQTKRVNFLRRENYLSKNWRERPQGKKGKRTGTKDLKHVFFGEKFMESFFFFKFQRTSSQEQFFFFIEFLQQKFLPDFLSLKVLLEKNLHTINFSSPSYVSPPNQSS